MAMGLKKLFGNGALPPEITGELRTTLLQMRQERSAFQALATRVQETMSGAERVAAPLNQVRESVTQLQTKVDALQAATATVSGVEARLTGLEARLDGAAEAADALRELLVRAEDAATETKADLAMVREGMGNVSAVKEALGEFLAMRADVAAVREELATLRAEAGTLRVDRDQVRSQHEAMVAENGTARAQLQQTVDQFVTLHADVAETAQRVDALRATIDPVAELVRGVPEARRDLQMLQALREYVARKLVGLEEQRDLVERVAERGERLELVLQRLEGELQRHTGTHATLIELAERVAALTTEHAEVEASCERIRAAHAELRAQNDVVRKGAEGVRTQLMADLERAASRFALERDGMDAVSERVAQLRAGLVDAEQRFQGLDEASLHADEVRADIGHLRELVVEIEQDVSTVALHGERVRELEQRVRPLTEATDTLTARLDALREPSETAIARAEERVSDLTVHVEVLEGRTDHLQGTAAALRSLGQEIDRQRLSLEATLTQLHEAGTLKMEAGTAAQRLSEQTAALTAGVRTAEERLVATQALAAQIDERAAQLAVTGAAMDRFEDRLREWKAMEGRLGRAMAQATERQEVVHALRADIHRMFALAEETADQVRATVAARGELEAGRALIEELAPRLEVMRAEAERLAERHDALTDTDALLARAEAALCDVRTSLQTLEDQKEFLDHVVTTAGALRFQTRQAESLVEALEEGWKRART